MINGYFMAISGHFSANCMHSAENEVGYLATFVVNSTSQSVELHYIHNKVATILPEEMSNF